VVVRNHNGAIPNIPTPSNFLTTVVDANTLELQGTSVTTAGSGGTIEYSTSSEAIIYTLSQNRQSLYTRFALKQSAGFNNNNADIAKIVRFHESNLNLIGTMIIRAGGGIEFGTDQAGDFTRVANVNLPFPGFNSFLGSWVWVEVFWDISNAGAPHAMVWVNDVLYMDQTWSTSTLNGKAIGKISYDGVVNSMDGSGHTEWFDEIGISTQRMGVPP
jgi:hypothetical protein